DAAQDYVAVRRTDLHAVSNPVEDLCGGHGGAAAEERVEHDVTGIRERLDEKLDQRPREGSRVRSLTAFGLYLDHVARPRYAGEPAIFFTRCRLARRRSARPGAEKPAPRSRLRVVGRIIEAVLRDVADRLRPELDLRLPAEVEYRLPGVLEAIAPTA